MTKAGPCVTCLFIKPRTTCLGGSTAYNRLGPFSSITDEENVPQVYLWASSGAGIFSVEVISFQMTLVGVKLTSKYPAQLPCGYWEPNPGPQQEQPLSNLSNPVFIFKICLKTNLFICSLSCQVCLLVSSDCYVYMTWPQS